MSKNGLYRSKKAAAFFPQVGIVAHLIMLTTLCLFYRMKIPLNRREKPLNRFRGILCDNLRKYPTGDDRCNISIAFEMNQSMKWRL